LSEETKNEGLNEFSSQNEPSSIYKPSQNEQGRAQNEQLLKDYDERARKRQFYAECAKMGVYALLTIAAAWYFGNMLFGKSSLETLLSLKATKKELNSRIEWLKEQNSRKQKEYFELKGLYPDEK
jgi:cell division protein FtsB